MSAGRSGNAVSRDRLVTAAKAYSHEPQFANPNNEWRNPKEYRNPNDETADRTPERGSTFELRNFFVICHSMTHAKQVHGPNAWQAVSLMLLHDKRTAPCRSPRPRPHSAMAAPASSAPRSTRRCFRWSGSPNRESRSGNGGRAVPKVV